MSTTLPKPTVSVSLPPALELKSRHAIQAYAAKLTESCKDTGDQREEMTRLFEEVSQHCDSDENNIDFYFRVAQSLRADLVIFPVINDEVMRHTAAMKAITEDAQLPAKDRQQKLDMVKRQIQAELRKLNFPDMRAFALKVPAFVRNQIERLRQLSMGEGSSVTPDPLEAAKSAYKPPSALALPTSRF